MATSIYWSGSFGGNSAGTYGRSASKSPSGNSVASSNYLNSVKCYQSMSATRYSSSADWRISFYSKYSDSTYYVGSPNSYGSYESYEGMTSTKGKISVNFTKNLSQFNNGSSSTSLYGKANNDASKSTSYMQQVWIRITYSSPSLTTPGAPTITQKNNGTYDASWTAATGSSGSGNVTYALKYGSTNAATGLTDAKKTGLSIPGYGTAYSFTVVATYSGLTKTSSATSKTFTKPAVKAPSNLKINSAASYTGRTAPLTWTAGSFSSYLTGTLAYEIYKGSTLVTTTKAGATSYTIPESTTKSWGTSAVTLKIRGKGTGLSNTSQGSTLYSGYTSTVSYTYKGAFTAAPTNLKINGGASYTGQTAPLSWSAATVSSGGTITYSIRKNGTEVATTTETSYTFAETTTKGWGTSAVKLTVVATSSGVDNSTASNEVSYTYASVLTAPSNLTISATTGQTATLSWTKATLSSGNTITYSIRKDGTEFTTTTSTSYTIPEATAKGWGTTAVSLTVVATGDGKTSSASNAVSFTYKPPYKTVKYYDGSKWVECTVHYYNGSSFQQVDPYYYTSSTAYTGTSHQ